MHLFDLQFKVTVGCQYSNPNAHNGISFLYPYSILSLTIKAFSTFLI